MGAGIYDITIEQGADFLLGLALKDQRGNPQDLMGVTAEGQVRKNINDTDPIVEFDITFDTNRSTGKLTLFVPAAITEVLDFVNGQYDLKLTYPDGSVKRVIKGKAIFSRAVTRPIVP